jgi:hypothetical protein
MHSDIVFVNQQLTSIYWRSGREGSGTFRQTLPTLKKPFFRSCGVVENALLQSAALARSTFFELDKA